LPRGKVGPALVPTPTQTSADFIPFDLDAQLRVLDAAGEWVRSVVLYPDLGGSDWEADVQDLSGEVRSGGIEGRRRGVLRRASPSCPRQPDCLIWTVRGQTVDSTKHYATMAKD
jgi:hypothetical protein